jgi:hypothetical protein
MHGATLLLRHIHSLLLSIQIPTGVRRHPSSQQGRKHNLARPQHFHCIKRNKRLGGNMTNMYQECNGLEHGRGNIGRSALLFSPPVAGYAQCKHDKVRIT